MANIVENFNQNQLDLIIENTEMYTFDEISGDYIRMSVNDGNRVTYQFYSNKNLSGNYIDVTNANNSDRQIIVYNNDSNIYVKPNEILESNNVISGNYSLQFDFMRDYFYSHYQMTSFTDIDTIVPQFYIHQISPTRKEIRLYGRFIDNESIDFNTEFQNTFKSIFGWVDDTNKLNEEHQQYLYDYFVTVSGGRNLQIINYAFDELSNPGQISLIIRLNKALPSDINLYKKVDINKEVISTQTETIIYNSDIESVVVSSPLTPDVQVYDEISVSPNEDVVQNYNQLVTSSSVSEINISSILSKNNDVNLNVNFNEFKNHTFFSSAKTKLSNFKNKVGEIQNYLTELSSSLNISGSYINGRRKQLFTAIQNVESNFTPYEKFLYRDGQSETSASAPGIGTNLALSRPVNQENLYKKLTNFDGFNVVYHHSGSDGEIVKLFDDKYMADKSPFFNYSGSVYLSFLMRGNQTLTGSNTNVLQWKNDNYSSDRLHIPSGALYQNRILEPKMSGSNWRRYIYQASQSHWTPTTGIGGINGNLSNLTLIEDLTNDTWTTDTYTTILQGNNVTGSHAIFDSSGQYGELINPTIINNDGDINTNIPRTGSVLPSGEYFKINWTADTNTTSSFITDIKVTKGNPQKALPFSHMYKTGSVEFTNWYNGLHSSASQFDENNINSLENNLPSYIKESTEYDDAKLFLKMWGEHFDLLKTYIDNFIKFYKREYKKVNSVPNNLLPILGDNLGWEFINPYTGSLANYFEIVSDGGESLENVKHETWKKVLNNLIYIYKTKGTHNSVNALLNTYGFPNNMFKLQEIGGSNETPSLTSNLSNQINNLLHGLESETSNISYVGNPHNLYSLNLTTPLTSNQNSSSVKLDWWTNDANGEAVEFIFKASPSTNEQVILLNSGSGDEKLWDLRLVPSSSNTTYSKLEFRLNNVAGATGSLSNNAISMSTGYLNNLSNNKLWNVLLQRMTSSTNANLTQSYQMHVGLQDSDKIITYNCISMSSDTTLSSSTGRSFSPLQHSASNLNFIGKGTLASTVSGNLIVGRTLTGSIAEFRVWNEALSSSRFKQHIFSKPSSVGNTLNSSTDNLIYRFRFNENYSGKRTNVKIIDSSPNTIKDYSRYLYTKPINYSVDRITNYKFTNTSEYNNVPNENKIIVKPKEYMYKDLEKDSVSVNRLTDKNIKLKYNSNKIIFSQNPIDVIDDFIINKISDHDTSQKYGKPSNIYSSSYGDLDKFRDKVLKDVKIDINKNIQVHKNKLPEGLTEGVKKLLPLRTEFDDVGVIIRPNILERTRIKYHKPQILGGSPEEQSSEMNIFDSFLNMNHYFGITSGSNLEQAHSNKEPINLENYLITTFSDLVSPPSMNLSLTSGSFILNNSSVITPYESNNINASGSLYNWNMEKINSYESNNINASGSLYNWNMDNIIVPEDSIDYSGLFNLKSVQHSPYSTNDINISSSLYNWDMGVSTPHSSNNINASGSLYNWAFEILEPYNSNNIHLSSGSTAIFKLKNPEVFSLHETNNINTSGSLYNWNMNINTPTEATINVSGSFYNWLFELLTPFESNEVNISSGSHPYNLNKFKPEVFLPSEATINVSGSFYNWNMDNIKTLDSNVISWEDEIYNLVVDEIKPIISNKISLVSGSYQKIDSELFSIKETNINISGSVYNWKMTKSSPHDVKFNYSGSLYNWQMEYIAGDKISGITTEIRDNYGLVGSRLGNIFNIDETINHGQGTPGSHVNLNQPIKHWYDAYGTGSNALHIWSSQTGSDGTNNTGFYEKQIIYHAIGDVEFISGSVFKDGLVDVSGSDVRIKSKGKSKDYIKYAKKHLTNQPAEIIIRDNTDFTNHKNFLNRILVDKGKGYTYKSYMNTLGDIEGKLDGRPLGRTAYISTGSLQSGAVKGQEDIVYPSNHYVNFPTSKKALRHLTYDGTQFVSGSFRAYDPRGEQYDPFPSTPAYSIEVEGSKVQGSRILKAHRTKGKDNKRK